jgi:hypothetical protein
VSEAGDAKEREGGEGEGGMKEEGGRKGRAWMRINKEGEETT